MGWIGRLFEEHKLVRRGIVLWAVGLITAVTIKVFWFPPTVPMSTATAFASVTALLSVAIGLYTWIRGREDAKSIKKDTSE